MSGMYPFCEQIRLHVEGRIAPEDAHRQERTAREILTRLVRRPGVILADEVGMGKTFVALAVAVSVALENRGHRPVVVMVPPSLHEKWPRDFELFRQKCLPRGLAEKLQYGTARRAVEFLKYLDDPPLRRRQIIFVTHGAMSRSLHDRWVELALIGQAIRGKHGVQDVRKQLSRVLADLLYMKWVEKHGSDIWIELLTKFPGDWLGVLRKWEIDPENDGDLDTDDDPVPKSVCDNLFSVDTRPIYDALEALPERYTETYTRRLQTARNQIRQAMREVWKACMAKLRLRLPLLILDEAHHLKNPNTQLASLFRCEESREDAEEVSRGTLAGVFERMIFLTATPFQLGHAELCSVLERLGGIAWQTKYAPSCGREGFEKEIVDLRRVLDAAQAAATSLDALWGRLTTDDLRVEDRSFATADEWWAAARGTNGQTPTARAALDMYEATFARMREAEKALRPWVIRHLKPKMLPAPHHQVKRRTPIVGGAIAETESNGRETGLPVHGEALLPFLLASRATTQAPEARPVFAEGLASSYEAFLYTRRVNQKKRGGATDGDDDGSVLLDETAAVRWYLDQLEALVPKGDPAASLAHPKIRATVNRALELWRTGEKVVVFCHYIATGKVLRQLISEGVDSDIRRLGAEKLECRSSEVYERLERIGKRFFDDDSPIYRACVSATRELLAPYPELAECSDELVNVVRRNVRTPAFLVRYFPLQLQLDDAAMRLALGTTDGSGLSLRDLLDRFFRFLVTHCGHEDRRKYIEAVQSIQTGAHFGVETAETFSDDELQGERVDRLLPNVRLVNGNTKPETRQRLMLTFNTPFYPEILVTSNVLSEGVDLHLNCRHIIHHDLCWNPSTLEQRTGRIDRIGAKAETCGQPIYVYLPFVAETQDEKMYRVVTDRERWFSVVMGENYKSDARSVDRMAERIPFPASAAAELAFRLTVDARDVS